MAIWELRFKLEVLLAKHAGFCFGVRRAVETVYEQIREHPGEKIYTFGPIIHNEEVVKDLEEKGVLKRKYRQPFRRREEWKFSLQDFVPLRGS